MAKSTYQCVLYDKGDKVQSKFPTLFEKPILEIEETYFTYVGIYPTLILKFVGQPKNITDLSNYFEPAGDTIEKYKDGLVYFKETKAGTAKTTTAKGIKTRSEITFKRPNKNEPIDLTDETIFKTRYVSKGTFSGQPPIKKNDEK